jgi:1,4-alpha-glucan branching enzyme
MLISADELAALAGASHPDPHALLGMHPLGDGSGIVVRVLAPDAASVEVRPVHEKTKPGLQLKRIGDSPLFEASTRDARQVYAYDVIVTDGAGNRRYGRDPYSFLPTLGETDLHLFNEGRHRRLYEALGAQLRVIDGVAGVGFAVWAPNARRVSVVGSWNQWDGRVHPMRRLGSSGIWEVFIPNLAEGALYKFEMVDANGAIRLKTDPFGFSFENPPKNAAVVWNPNRHRWADDTWLDARRRRNALREPMSIYEVHLGSWRRKENHESPGYRELAGELIDYVRRTGFTHVEFLPVAEHAYYPSWGYQVTGFYAPTRRYGPPEDFQHLVEALHEAGIGVLLDWVPAHFPRDDWALARFDGTALYEHEDPRQGAHQDWGTLIFNYGRHEVSNFLTANALYWLDRFHIDGLRVDAVASMLYLDYSRRSGEWVPNRFGGRENIEAIDFLRQFNETVHTEHPGIVTVAEESTSWPMVSRPPWIGGLGFSLKWNMGWMHDTLGYFKREPVHRKHHQHDLTFATLYKDHENFVLPLSHDEVVHGKGSLRRRMPGDDWQAFANLRALLGYQWLFPGKKLLFMGGEIGQPDEWSADSAVAWHLLDAGPFHKGLQRWVADLNTAYRREPALWRGDYEIDGFWWIDCADNEHSILSFIRHASPEEGSPASWLLSIFNLTPVPRSGYRIGLPRPGRWVEVLNSDSAVYGGSNMGNLGGVDAAATPSHNQAWSADFVLPPLSVVAFRASE